MAYGLHPNKCPFAGVEHGGGTLTLRCWSTPRGEWSHASAGDNLFGGEDFTHMLVDEVLKHADVAGPRLTRVNWEAVACVEAAKCSNQSPLHIHWRSRINAGVRIFRERLEDLWLPLLNRLRVPIERRCAMHV
ncbi:hypothetical protein ACNKHL_03705 [Shigella flexneri]